MATITFKVKAVAEINADDTATGAYIIKVPQFKKNHCDMNAFRTHSKFGSYANSDLFTGILARVRRDLFPAGFFLTSATPENVTVNLDGFLAVVTIEV